MRSALFLAGSIAFSQAPAITHTVPPANSPDSLRASPPQTLIGDKFLWLDGDKFYSNSTINIICAPPGDLGEYAGMVDGSRRVFAFRDASQLVVGSEFDQIEVNISSKTNKTGLKYDFSHIPELSSSQQSGKDPTLLTSEDQVTLVNPAGAIPQTPLSESEIKAAEDESEKLFSQCTRLEAEKNIYMNSGVYVAVPFITYEHK